MTETNFAGGVTLKNYKIIDDLIPPGYETQYVKYPDCIACYVQGEEMSVYDWKKLKAVMEDEFGDNLTKVFNGIDNIRMVRIDDNTFKMETVYTPLDEVIYVSGNFTIYLKNDRRN